MQTYKEARTLMPPQNMQWLAKIDSTAHEARVLRSGSGEIAKLAKQPIGRHREHSTCGDEARLLF